MGSYDINCIYQKKGRSKASYSNLFIRGLEKEEKFKPKARRIKERIKIKVEIHEMKKRKITQKVSETKSGSLKR